MDPRSSTTTRTSDLEAVDVLILCGGQGLRLRSIVHDRPKPMADVQGRPFLEHMIRHVEKQGFRNIILAAGYMGEVIQQHFRSWDGPSHISVILEPSPLGTGGAILNARTALRSTHFLCLNGDSFCPIDLAAFLRFHMEHQTWASLVVVPPKGATSDTGRVIVSSDHSVLGFSEKPSPTESSETCWVNAGVYAFHQDIFGLFPPTGPCSLERDIFPRLPPDKFKAFRSEACFWDIGTPERYRRIANHWPEDAIPHAP